MIALPVTVAERAIVAHYAPAGEVRARCIRRASADRCTVVPQLEDPSLDRRQAWTVRAYRQDGQIRIERMHR